MLVGLGGLDGERVLVEVLDVHRDGFTDAEQAITHQPYHRRVSVALDGVLYLGDGADALNVVPLHAVDLSSAASASLSADAGKGGLGDSSNGIDAVMLAVPSHCCDDLCDGRRGFALVVQFGDVIGEQAVVEGSSIKPCLQRVGRSSVSAERVRRDACLD